MTTNNNSKKVKFTTSHFKLIESQRERESVSKQS